MAVTEEKVVVNAVSIEVVSGTITRYIIEASIHASTATDAIKVVIGTTASHLVGVATYDGGNAMTNDYNLRFEDIVGTDFFLGELTDDTTAKVTKATDTRWQFPSDTSRASPPPLYNVAAVDPLVGEVGATGFYLKCSSITGALQTADNSFVVILYVSV